jgi:hypothetical protein
LSIQTFYDNYNYSESYSGYSEFVYQAVLVESDFQDVNNDFSANFSSNTLDEFWYQDPMGDCYLTTHWDPRSGNILGWYVQEDSSCPYSDWTYS